MITQEKKLTMINIMKNLSYFVIGSFLIFNVIYFKILIIRLPKELVDIQLPVSVLLSILFFILYFKTVCILLNITKDNMFTQYIKIYLIQPLHNLIENALSLIDDYIKHTLLGPKILGKNLLKISLYINKYLKDQNSIIIFVLFDVCPRVLLIVFFAYDIIIITKLTYIYIYGWLTLIPLFFRYLVYTFQCFAKANIKGLTQDYILLTDKEYNELPLELVLANYNTNLFWGLPTQDFKAIAYTTLRKDSTNFDEDLTFYLSQFYCFANVYTSMDFFYNLRKHNNYYLFLALIYFCYWCLWGSITLNLLYVFITT